MKPLNWIATIEKTVMEEIPLLPSSFPWDEWNAELSDRFSLPITTKIHTSTWRPEETLFADLGSTPFIQSFSLKPLEGHLFLAISSEDLKILSAHLLSADPLPQGLSGQSLQESFYDFLLEKAQEIFNNLHPLDPHLSLRKESQEPLALDGALCLEIEIGIHEQTAWARLIIPETFRSALKQHTLAPPSLQSPLRHTAPLPIKIEIGHTQLNYSEWKSVHPGSVVLLDKCSFDPETNKGTATLVAHTTPLFHVKLREEKIKILDYALYYEATMTDNPETPKKSEEEWEEEEGEHLWSQQAAHEEKREENLAHHNIPLSLTVEVARINMTLEKLMELAPGNSLELGVHPEQGVYLTLSGKRVAHGELVKIGEVLGVRIIKLLG